MNVASSPASKVPGSSSSMRAVGHEHVLQLRVHERHREDRVDDLLGELHTRLEGALHALGEGRVARAVLVLHPGLHHARLAGAAAARALALGVAQLAAEVQLQVLVGHLARPPDRDDLALLDQHRAVAEAVDRGHVVGHEHDRLALLAEVEEHVEALLLEGGVAHGQDLVDQQHVGVHLDHHGEGEPHVHPRRVVLQLEVGEVLELGELDHPLDPLGGLGRGEAEHHAVEQDVVARRELHVEAHAELDERRDPPRHLDPAAVEAVDAGQALQQRALARPVSADDPEELAGLDVEADVLEGVQAVAPRTPQRVQHPLLEGVPLLVGDAEGLRGAVDHDGQLVGTGHRRNLS